MGCLHIFNAILRALHKIRRVRVVLVALRNQDSSGQIIAAVVLLVVGWIVSTWYGNALLNCASNDKGPSVVGTINFD